MKLGTNGGWLMRTQKPLKAANIGTQFPDAKIARGSHCGTEVGGCANLPELGAQLFQPHQKPTKTTPKGKAMRLLP